MENRGSGGGGAELSPQFKRLVRFSDEAKYRPMFLWDDTISASIRASDPQKLYAAEIFRALKKFSGG